VCGDHQASWSMGASPELSPELELLVSGGSPPAPSGRGLGRWQPRAGAGSGRSRLHCEALGATRTQLHLCRFRGGAAAAGTSSVVVCRSCCGGGGLLMVQLVHCPLEQPCSNLSCID
jgi:hypothetical protein